MYNDILFKDLHNLRNIINDFTLREPINDEEKEDIQETMNELMHIYIEENIDLMSNPHFESYLEEYVIENVEKFIIYSDLFDDTTIDEIIKPILEDIYKNISMIIIEITEPYSSEIIAIM